MFKNEDEEDLKTCVLAEEEDKQETKQGEKDKILASSMN